MKIAIAERRTYLREVVNQLLAQWPGNRTVNIVCHGHSVPAGYFATPMVDTFNSYPALLHQGLRSMIEASATLQACVAAGGDPTDLLSWSNLLNRRGHELVAQELMRWFAIP